MNAHDTQEQIRRTLAAWDGTEPAGVSPFLWTRIRSGLFEGGEVRAAALKPVVKWALGVWVLLFVAQLGVWIVGNSQQKQSSTSDGIHEVFFSDESPYSGSR